MQRVPIEFQAGALASSLFVLFIYLKRRDISKLPLPPGPKKLPLIGNLLNYPKTMQWLTFHKWSQQLGSDIIHLDVAGTSIVVLDTEEAVAELFEKRSSIYSSRPRMTMVHELMGLDFLFALLPYGESWRQQRRLMHQEFQQHAATRFHPHELKATHRLLRHLLDNPNNLMDRLRYMAGKVILSIAYGIQVQEKDDPYIITAERAVRPISIACVPGTFLVDTIPILKYVPDWVPFASFKRKAKEWRQLAMTMLNMPFETAMRDIKNGKFTPSFTSYGVENIDESGDMEHQKHIIKGTASTMYIAGTDTTTGAIASCILGLLYNPGSLKKAQQEMDSVIGTDRLPTFDDRGSLPYMTAITKEALRWREVSPMGLPHFIEVEDEYKGYRIPAGSVVIPNSWAMLHNETTYPDPFTFNPDRYMKDGKLDPDAKDPATVAFGFGRRICPGRYMAFSSVWITLASMIATMDISKAVDENGQIINPRDEYSFAIACLPLPFKCSIKPRSSQAEALIWETVDTEYF